MFSILQVNNSVLWKGVAGKVASHKGERNLFRSANITDWGRSKSITVSQKQRKVKKRKESNTEQRS